MGTQKRRYLLLLLQLILLVGLFVLTAYVLNAGFRARLLPDVRQPQLDAAFPPLEADDTVGQSFIAGHPNLSAVELTLVVYQTADPSPADDATLTFRLYRSGEDGPPLVTVVTQTAQLIHNQVWRITFPPLRDSAGQEYTFFVEGDAGNQSSLWYSSLDSYRPGRLYRGRDVQRGDLYFSTFYTYDFFLFWHEVGQFLQGPLVTALLFLLVLVASGFWLADHLSLLEAEDGLARLALALGVSLALFPLLFLWATAAGVRLQPVLFKSTGALVALCFLWYLWRRHSRARLRLPRPTLYTVVGVFLLGAVLFVRIIQVREFAVPPGIDGPHHGIITRLMASTGQAPQTFRPLLPIDNARYHFGFHSTAVGLHWLTGTPQANTMLILGQLLNATAILGAYLLATYLSGRRQVGLGAIMVTGFLSVFPAYYSNWGRYTVLAALTLLPGAVVVLLNHVRWPSRRSLLAGGLLWAGLFLTHYQMLALGACFVLVYLLMETARRRRTHDASGALWVRTGQVAALALLFSLPWLLHLENSIDVDRLRMLLTLKSQYNVPSFHFLEHGHFGWLLPLAFVGTLWAIRRRQLWSLLLWLWLALAFDIANWKALGMFGAFLLNNSAVILILFLPVSILVGYLLAELYGALRHFPWLRTASLICLAVIIGHGSWASTELVEPATAYVTDDELEAMAWIESHTPVDALFLVNTQLHAPDLLVTGPDGGVWVPALTGRRTTLPPITYGQGPLDYRAEVRELAAAIEAAPTLDNAEVRKLLRNRGVTHIFLGSTPGLISPFSLHENRRYRLIFSNGGARVYERLGALTDE